MRILLFLFCFIALPAQASVFVWQDPVHKVSLAYPDTWDFKHNQKPDDVLSIWAPGVNEYASCRVRVRGDKRHVIFARSQDHNVRNVVISDQFWDEYTAEFERATLHRSQSAAQIDLAYAGWADFSFVAVDGPKVQKRAIAMAGLYNGKVYVFECSADYQAFDKWKTTFGHILSSVRLRQEKDRYVHENYRSFMADSPIVIKDGHVFKDYLF